MPAFPLDEAGWMLAPESVPGRGSCAVSCSPRPERGFFGIVAKPLTTDGSSLPHLPSESGTKKQLVTFSPCSVLLDKAHYANEGHRPRAAPGGLYRITESCSDLQTGCISPVITTNTIVPAPGGSHGPAGAWNSGQVSDSTHVRWLAPRTVDALDLGIHPISSGVECTGGKGCELASCALGTPGPMHALAHTCTHNSWCPACAPGCPGCPEPHFAITTYGQQHSFPMAEQLNPGVRDDGSCWALCPSLPSSRCWWLLTLRVPRS